MDDVIRTKLLPYESHSNEVIPPYIEKLRAKAAQSSAVHLINENNSVSHPESNALGDGKDKEEFTLVWLDQRLDIDKPDLRNLATLRDIVDFLQVFTNPDSCFEYISKIPHSNVHLIVSGSMGHKIVPRVHDLGQIRSIYILCRRKQEHTNWASKYAKIRPEDIFTNVKPLIERLKTDLYKCQKVRGISYKIERSIVDVHNDEVNFQWSYRLTQTLISWSRSSKAQDQMIEYMRHCSQENQSRILFLDDLARHYTATDAIQWYTKAGCLFQLVNRALRDESIDEIFIYRSFIKDLSEQLTLLHHEQRNSRDKEYCLYRGTRLPYDDIAVLKANQGKLISFNGFLSTSLDRQIASLFIQPSNEQEQVEAVLFEYHVNTSLDTSAYAYIGFQSLIPDEKEVLFDIGAVFRIDSAKYDSDEKIWLVRCILCEKKDLGRLHIEGLDSSTEGFLSFVQYGRLLIGMCELQRARIFFDMLSNEATNDSAKAICLVGLADIYSMIGDRIRFSQIYQKVLNYLPALNEKLDGMNKFVDLNWKLGCVCSTAGNFDDALYCFGIYMSRIEDENSIENRISLAVTVGAVGHVYYQLGDYTTALLYYQQEAKLAEEFYATTMNQATLYGRLGAIYIERNEYDKALDYLGKALDIVRKILPSNHVNRHVLNNSIGLAYLNKGYLESALECFTTALEFFSQKLELNMFTEGVYANLGYLYRLQNKFDLSFMCYKKAAELHLGRNPGSSHPTLAAVYVQTAILLRSQSKFDAAENLLSKAHAMYQKRNMPHKIAECFAEISSLHLEKGDMIRALIFMAKTLSIRKQICGENHVNVGVTYSNMGTIWLQLGNTERALHFIAKSLLILKFSSTIPRIECGNAYEVLGSIYVSRSSYLLGIKYMKKSVKIRRMYLAEDHFQIGATYRRLGQAYGFLKRFDIAFKYLQKARVVGVKSYLIDRDIGDIYSMQQNNAQALESYNMALANAKLKCDGNHEEIAEIYLRIGGTYSLRKEYDSAAENYMKALEYNENSTYNKRELICKYSMYLARALRLGSQCIKAIGYFQRAINNLPESDPQVLENRWEIALCYKWLADKCNEESNFLKAFEYYEQALTVLRQYFPLQADAIEVTESLIKQIHDGLTSNE